jgi:hypothetical protein
MRKIRLLTAMAAVAVLGVTLSVGLALRRRAQRLDGLAIRYGREASNLDNLLARSKLSRHAAESIIERVHWHDAVAGQYRIAAARPWLPFDPSPWRVTCECSYHAARQPHPTTR